MNSLNGLPELRERRIRNMKKLDLFDFTGALIKFSAILALFGVIQDDDMNHCGVILDELKIRGSFIYQDLIVF